MTQELETEQNEFEAGHGVFTFERAGLGERVLDAWRDMRASTRRLLREKPSEGRLIFYVLASDMVFFISWSLKTMVAPAAGTEPLMSTDKIGLLMVGALMLRTAAMYLFSLLVFVPAKISGGAGTFKETRAGVFWGAFVSAPFGLLAAILSVGLGVLSPDLPFLQREWVALPVYWLGLIPFVWYISAGVAEAHKFRMTSPTFMVMSVVALALTAGTLLFGVKDMLG
ncbi:MAG: hypothetical protein GY947_04810 [Rhodobacteraceae bacterium]|nr:hypothetical protein [Paracoccaceae bacterium]